MKFTDLGGIFSTTEELTLDQVKSLAVGRRVASFPDPETRQPAILAPEDPMETEAPTRNSAPSLGGEDCFVFRDDWGRDSDWGGFVGADVPRVMTNGAAVRDLLRRTGVANDTEIDLGNGKVLVLEDIILAPLPGEEGDFDPSKVS